MMECEADELFNDMEWLRDEVDAGIITPAEYERFLHAAYKRIA